MTQSRLLIAIPVFLVLALPARGWAQDEPLPDEPGKEALGPEESPPPPEPAPPAPAAPAPMAPAPAPATTGKVWGLWDPWPILQPPGSYLFPIESGALDSAVDLQFLFTNFSQSFMGRSVSANIFMLGLDARYAILDRFEVGLTVPFLTHALASVGSQASDSTQFGNITLNLKGKIYGDSRGPLAVSAFLNTLLPTGTGMKSHEYGALHVGGAVSGAISRLTLGSALGTYWAISGPGSDTVLLCVDMHSAFWIHRVVAGYLGLQLGVPLHPGTGEPGFGIATGVQVFPIPSLHLDLGARIGVNDGGRALYAVLGRAALMFAAGYRFQ